MIEKTRHQCIDCGICTKNCDFLKKYGINLKDFTYREDLRYSCFLCGKCTSLCPKKLSGPLIALEMREEKSSGSLLTSLKKRNYIFKNPPKRKSKDLLYLGCNYPGVYPKTSTKLIELASSLGVDYTVDCCKKPLVEVGKPYNFENYQKYFKEKGVERLICACPNCYGLLKKELDIEVVSVYEFLYENKLGEKIKEEVNVFFPCSDRYTREIFSYIKAYVESYKEPFEKVNCCGLGGGAYGYEIDLVEKTKERLKELNTENIYTYCSSCSLAFKRYGLKGVKNFLSEILGVHEEASDSYMKNVIAFKYRKH